MEIFYRLLFGHFLADFTFQTNYIADWKRRSMVGLLVHVLTHPLCYVVLAFPYLNDTWITPWGFPLKGWTSVGITTLLHFIEDWFRVTMVNKGWPDNSFFYTWDQVVHLVVLWLVCPIYTQAQQTLWPILGTLFVLVTHFATVTVYFIGKDLAGKEYPETEEKYVTILQRLVVWIAFFLPHPIWIMVVIFVLIGFGAHVRRTRSEYSFSGLILGNLIALGGGLFTRFVLNYHF